MRCPQCGARETRVVDSRDLEDLKREVDSLYATRGAPADVS